jgi:hypothetical protein
MKMLKNALLTCGCLALTLSGFAQKQYAITSYGAKPGFNTNNAISIQKAIDAAAADNGGKVTVPAGIFITGPLVLKTGVELHLADDALLLGSAKRMDYPNDKMAVISAVNQHHISITGNGIIDGQGRDLVENALLLLRQGLITDPEWLLKRPTEGNRPGVLHFKGCVEVKVTGITVKNSAGWVQSYSNCIGVIINHIKVQSTAYWNNDGIDIVDSKDVRITNCFVNAADDGICLKSESATGRCENIYVDSCTIRSSASGFKIGTGSVGTFKNIVAKNLLVYDTYRSAIALESVDGAVLEDIDIRNVVAKNTGNAIFIRLGHRNKDARYGTLKHVYIGKVQAHVPFGKPDIGYPIEGPLPKIPPHNLIPSSITGMPGHPVDDVTLEDISITYGGYANAQTAKIGIDALNTIPENIAGYPEFTMFGELPAWALYVRHAEAIKIKNITVKLMADDFRPAFVFDDVKGLDIDHLNIAATAVVPAVIINHVESPLLKNMGDSGNRNMIKIQ